MRSSQQNKAVVHSKVASLFSWWKDDPEGHVDGQGLYKAFTDMKIQDRINSQFCYCLIKYIVRYVDHLLLTWLMFRLVKGSGGFDSKTLLKSTKKHNGLQSTRWK